MVFTKNVKKLDFQAFLCYTINSCLINIKRGEKLKVKTLRIYMKKERMFVNPFKLFFGNSEPEMALSPEEVIESSDISEEEKAALKKALKEVEKFEKQMNNVLEQVKHKNSKLHKNVDDKHTVITKSKKAEIDRERE